MPSPMEQAVRDILREAGRPVPLAEIAAELDKRVTITAKNPRNSVRAVLNHNRACVASTRGSYVFTRVAVNGASVRERLRLTSVKGGYCAVGAELIGLLWPGFDYGERPRSPKLSLDGGPVVTVTWHAKSRAGVVDAPYKTFKPPPPFWAWWEARQAEGADEIVVRCEDGEAGRYTVRAIRRADLDDAAIAAANDAVRAEAADALRGGDSGTSFGMLTLRLLVREPYHREFAPDSIPSILLSYPPAFHYSGWDQIEYRPDITPAIGILLRDRILEPWLTAEHHIRAELRLPPETYPSGDEFASIISPAGLPWMERPPGAMTPETEVVHAVRFKVTLRYHPGVSRTIEVRDDQTLEVVHDAIRDAFEWDRDHLYSFNLSARRHDQLTEIQRGSSIFGSNPPAPHEVTLRDVGLTRKHKIGYLFDFGASWHHELTVLAIVPADGNPYPRLVASEGEAPRQYDLLDEEDDDWDDDGNAGDPFFWGVEDSPIEPMPGFPPAQFAGLSLIVASELLDAFDEVEPFTFNDLSQFDLPAADPALRRLVIDLNLLAPAFELPPPAPIFLDAERGDVLMVPPVDTPEIRLSREAIEASSDRYLPVPVPDTEAQIETMAAFAAATTDAGLRADLMTALHGKHPAERFYRALERDPAAAERWTAVVDRRVIEATLAWLAGHGIYPEPLPTPDPLPLPTPSPAPEKQPPGGVDAKNATNRPKKRRRT